MPRNFCLKSLFYGACIAVFSFFWASCVNPVGINNFLEDEKVIDIIESERVGLIDNTGDNLVAGNRRITGLDPNKYYRVEELNDGGNPVNASYRKYVGSAGVLSTNIIVIGRVSGRAITGLNNDITYRVYAAASLTGSMTWYDTASLPLPTGNTENVTNGVLTLPESQNGGFYLNLNPAITTTNIEMVRVPATSVTYETGNIIKLLHTSNTSTDYVFAEKDISGNIVKFSYLTVVIDGPAPPPSLTINLTIFNNPSELASSGAINVYLSQLLSGLVSTVTINFTALPGYTPVLRLNGAVVTGGFITITASSVAIDFTNPAIITSILTTEGVHELLLEFSNGTDTYGGLITYTVIKDAP